MSHLALFLCTIATTVVFANSYGYKFRKLPGTNDCRLQLNLPGYPPSFHSSVGYGSRYSEKYGGAGSQYDSKDKSRPGSGSYGGSNYGSSSSSSGSYNSGHYGGSRPTSAGGSLSSSLSSSNREYASGSGGSYRPNKISNGDDVNDEYGHYGSSSSASTSGSRFQQGSQNTNINPGGVYGSGEKAYNSYESDRYGSSSSGNRGTGNDKTSYTEELQGFQNFSPSDMVECYRNEYYSKRLRKCVLRGSDDEDQDNYGSNNNKAGGNSNSNIGGSSSFSSSSNSNQNYGGGFEVVKSTSSKPPRVVASSSTAYVPDIEAFVGSGHKVNGFVNSAGDSGSAPATSGYNTNRENSYIATGSSNDNSGGYGTAQSFGSSQSGVNYGSNSDDVYPATGSSGSSSNSQSSYGSSSLSGGYGTDSDDGYPSQGGIASASSNKGNSYGTEQSYGSTSGSGGYGINYNDENGNSYGSASGQQYGSSGNTGYGTNAQDEYAQGDSNGGYQQDKYSSNSRYGSSSSNRFASSSGSSSGFGNGNSASNFEDANGASYGSSSSSWNSNNFDYDDKNKETESSGYDRKYAEDALEAHNIYRAKHNSPPLELDEEMSQSAQELAEKFAAGFPFGHSPEAKSGKFGESIAVKSGPTTGATVVDFWYNENVNYDFKNPKLVLSPPNKSNAEFSALVWSSTRKLGIGKAIGKDGRTFIVANYYPPGNYPSKLADNIFPAKRISKQPSY